MRASSAQGRARPLLGNIVPRYLAALARGDGGNGHAQPLLERHVAARIREGFALDEILEEIAALGRAIVAEARDPSADELASLYATFSEAAVVASRTFHEHMASDEQEDKRIVCELQRAATEAPEGERAAPLAERLGGVLDVVLRAVRAASVTLLVFDRRSQSLITAASVGAAADVLERHANNLGASALATAIAHSDDEPIAIDDVTTTTLDVGEPLRQSGIHSLLAIRVPSRRRLMGAVYIGFAEAGAPTPRTMRRAELLGEQLTLHLYSAELSGELRATIREMETERSLRDRLVSILAHDLRGPLTIARLHAQRLSRGEGGAESASVVIRSLDRADRMVRDLLDTLLIRAGHRLPLQIVKCDLVAIARDVIAELSALHGERFVLAGDSAARGYWSAQDMRRALWNLMTNAVKYGARGAPIEVGVVVDDDTVRVSVHNDGAPIPAARRARLFEPFGQVGDDSRGRHGWGLGLALVHGTAVAHGGDVDVESNERAGTTFTIFLPKDARGVLRDQPPGVS